MRTSVGRGTRAPTEVPYASKILPANGPRKYKKKIWSEPMRDIDEDEDDGRSVVS